MIHDMTNTQKGVRIKILPTLKASVLLAAKHYRIGLILMWVPFVLLCVLSFIDIYSDQYHDIIYDIFGHHEHIIITDYINLIMDSLITAPFMIALYRLYILSEENYSTWHYKRGLYEQKTVLKINWYCKFGKRELMVAVLSIMIGLIFLAAHSIHTAIKMNSIVDFTNPSFTDYTIIKYMIRFLEDIVYAAIILIWPAIAVSKTFKFSSIPSLIKAIKGNIFRVYIIHMIIYSPLLVLGYLSAWTFQPINALSGISIDILYDAETVIYLLLYFACYAVNIAFISLIYKDMKNTGHLSHE